MVKPAVGKHICSTNPERVEFHKLNSTPSGSIRVKVKLNSRVTALPWQDLPELRIARISA